MTTGTDLYRSARDLLLDLRADPERAVREFAWPALPARFNWAHDWFDAVARGDSRIALHLVEEDGRESRFDFDRMARRSDQVARLLADAGVRRGDRVMLMLGNQVELWESMLAVMKLGAVILPTTTALGPADLADRLDRGQARVVVANPADTGKFAGLPGERIQVVVGPAAQAPAGWVPYARADTLDDAPLPHPGTGPADPVLLYFTSGTTSRPKLVEHTQVSYPVGHLTTMYWIGLRPGDVHLNISSPGWAKHAWSCFFAPWAAQATVFVVNYGRFEPGRLLERLRTGGVTTFCAPPTVWRMLITTDLGGRPAALREVVAAGEPLNPEVIERVRQAWGLVIRDGFGQTETTALIGNPPGARVIPGSMGRPLPGVPIVLVDPLTGQPADEGEICIDLGRRPVNLMTGYRDDAALDAEVTAGGRYHTGDVACRDTDGYITYIGRTDDVFKASDYKVSPFELESVLIEHPAVTEAAVVPAPDPVRLAVPKAYVTLAPDWAPDRDTALAILRHARNHLPGYLRVRRVEFADLPKTISGKIRRVELRAREAEALTAGATLREWREEDFPELRDAAG